MMSTCCDEIGWNSVHGVHKHGHDNGDVGQMGAAIIRGVEGVNVTTADMPRALCKDRPDTFAHRSKMHWHMRGIGDERSVRIKQRTGKIEPFTDIDRRCAMLKRCPHFFGNGHKQPVEDFEPNRINRSANRYCRYARRIAGKDEVTDCIDNH